MRKRVDRSDEAETVMSAVRLAKSTYRAGRGAGETQSRGAVWNEPRPDLIQLNSPERNRNTEP